MVVLVLVLNFRARKSNTVVSVQEICEKLFGEVAVLADKLPELAIALQHILNWGR